MQHKFRTTLMAIALLSSVSGVFAAEISNAFSGKKLVTYSWQKYLSDGSTEDGLPIITDNADNPFPSQCEGNGAKCAVGTPDDRQEQVITFRHL